MNSLLSIHRSAVPLQQNLARLVLFCWIHSRFCIDKTNVSPLRSRCSVSAALSSIREMKNLFYEGNLRLLHNCLGIKKNNKVSLLTLPLGFLDFCTVVSLHAPCEPPDMHSRKEWLTNLPLQAVHGISSAATNAAATCLESSLANVKATPVRDLPVSRGARAAGRRLPVGELRAAGEAGLTWLRPAGWRYTGVPAEETGQTVLSLSVVYHGCDFTSQKLPVDSVLLTEAHI